MPVSRSFTIPKLKATVLSDALEFKVLLKGMDKACAALDERPAAHTHNAADVGEENIGGKY